MLDYVDKTTVAVMKPHPSGCKWARVGVFAKAEGTVEGTWRPVDEVKFTGGCPKHLIVVGVGKEEDVFSTVFSPESAGTAFDLETFEYYGPVADNTVANNTWHDFVTKHRLWFKLQSRARDAALFKMVPVLRLAWMHFGEDWGTMQRLIIGALRCAVKYLDNHPADLEIASQIVLAAVIKQ